MWLRCYCCERRRGACLPAVAGKLLRHSHVAQEPLRCCRCSRRHYRHSHIELHALGLTQLRPECAKSLWTRTEPFAHFWFANQGRRTFPQQCSFRAEHAFTSPSCTGASTKEPAPTPVAARRCADVGRSHGRRDGRRVVAPAVFRHEEAAPGG